MKFSAIELSRILAFVDLNDLTPYGSISLAKIAPRLVEKLEFSSFPKTLEQFDESKGIVFEEGIWDGIPVQKMTIYNNGIMMDTRKGTDASLEVLKGVFDWAVIEFGLVVPEFALQNIRFLNSFTFFSDKIGYLGGTPVGRLAESLSQRIAEITGRSRSYETIRIDIDFDRLEQQVPIAPLTIQRRIASPFEQNKFYSEAPLPTDVHIALIEQLEADIHASTIKR
jgi:hypothetical protein